MTTVGTMSFPSYHMRVGKRAGQVVNVLMDMASELVSTLTLTFHWPGDMTKLQTATG